MLDFDHLFAERYTGELEFFIEERSDDHIVSRMPVKKGVLNPFGTVHAGAMFWFADVTATLLAMRKTKLNREGKGFPLAVNLHTTLLGNQRDGEIKADARFVRNGKSITVVRTRLTGNDGRVLAEVVSTHVPAF